MTATSSLGSPARIAGRRRVLPNRRAVAGGLLVAAAAVGTFAAWSGATGGPSQRYLVATVDLPIGHVVTVADVEAVAMDVPAALAGRAFAEPEQLVGQRTVAPVAEGDLLQRSAVVVPDGPGAAGSDSAPARQLSFAIDPADALAGTLQEGETVDVLVTYGSDAAAVTEVAAEDATVAGISGGGDGGRFVVLLSLADDVDVLALTTAVRRGDLTLVR